jgi:hypothetical protein
MISACPDREERAMPKYLSDSERAALEKLLEDDRDDDDPEEIEHNGKKYKRVPAEEKPAGEEKPAEEEKPKPPARRRFVT